MKQDHLTPVNGQRATVESGVERKDDGGPAFPVGDTRWGKTVDDRMDGMTLRDYFAAKAMQGFSVSDSEATTPTKWNWDVLAKAAYQAADAMLKARSA